jgi:putative transposase
VVEYRRSAHAVTDIKYHVIWVTKYRYKILRGDIAQRARELLRQICVAREVTIVRGAVSPDHIHMLVAVPPQIAPAKLVQFLKGRSSRLLQREFPALRKRFWGQQLWARGYYCASVGAVDEKTIREYIENQRWDEVDGFTVTAPTEPSAGE